MTVYGSKARRRFRPTLRVRLALINGAILGVVALVLVIVAAVLGRNELIMDVLAILVITLVAVAAGYVVIARALRPLQQVTATARRLSGETLDQRINYAGADDEVAELAATFDAMLDRLAEAFETQKRFVANASHELRTPLAVMRTEIDVTLSDPDADVAEFRRMGTVVRDATERANSLVESLLVLARSEAQAGRRLVRKTPTDLADGVTAALSAVQREVGRLGLDISTDLRPAVVVGDPSLLERLAGNLIENAVRYNRGQGRVWVRTETDGVTARLIVGNTGFEVDAGDVPKLFEAFRRDVRDRTGSGRGAGLGLSIVRAVADAHGGSVRAEPMEGGGLEVIVALPAAAATPVATGSAAVSAVAGSPPARPSSTGGPARA
jgi:signal transduction histidine kinase